MLVAQGFRPSTEVAGELTRSARAGRVAVVGLLVTLIVATLLAVMVAVRTDAPREECWSRPFQVGAVANADGKAAADVQNLGATLLRVEFGVETPLDEVEAAVAAAAAARVRLQPLIGWAGGEPAPDLTFLAEWARRFGPEGSFWSGGNGDYAITEIELGNENSYTYKSGDVDRERYGKLAREYGRRALAAARTVRAANPRVGVLVELESGGTNVDAWVAGVLESGGTELVDLMRGPVVHAYGPDWRAKLAREQAMLARHGVAEPYFVTEWGVAADDGAQLDDNYGFPRDLTYAQAGRILDDTITTMSSLQTVVRQVLLYQIRDQRPPGTGHREHYFGLLTVTGADKGELTSRARALLARFSCPST